MDVNAKDILDFWFQEIDKEKWFNGGEGFDNLVRARFLAVFERAIHGDFDSWSNDAKESLAFIILIDQFSRNMFRDTNKMYEHDALALTCCKHGIEKGYIDQLQGAERLFFMMPLIHSEDLADQKLGVQTLEKYYKNEDGYEQSKKFYERHEEIIEKFGRFPHRNKILGRTSTPEEEAFLKEPFSSF
jgi:uncharacterized protein (DUF924 family)